MRRRLPEIEWKQIAGMRDWLAHAYFAINDEILWNAIETEVPELLRTLRGFKDEGQA